MHDRTSGFHSGVSGQYSSKTPAFLTCKSRIRSYHVSIECLKFVSGIPTKGYYSGRILTQEPRRIHPHVQTPLICIQSVLSYGWISLRKHPFIIRLALRRWGRFAQRKVTFLRATTSDDKRMLSQARDGSTDVLSKGVYISTTRAVRETITTPLRNLPTQ